MSLVIDLDDRALSIARDGVLLSSAPSVVFDGTNGTDVGSNAWRQLQSRLIGTSSRHLSTLLTQGSAHPRAGTLTESELTRRLLEHPPAIDERVWMVAPALAEPQGLSALLGILRRCRLRIDGFIDHAAMTAAALGLRRNAIFLECGLHHVAASAVDCDGNLARRMRSIVSEGGLLELYRSWLEVVSTTMVRRTRFDPLHDASTEQQLFDALPAVAATAASEGSAVAAVTTRGQRFEVALTRDQFAQAADPIFRSGMGLLHELRPAGATVSIVLASSLATLPGLRERLEQFSGCELVSVPDGFAASAASRLDLPGERSPGDAVRLIRRLPIEAEIPWDEQVTRESLGRLQAREAASHVLWDGRAYSLDVDSLTVGRIDLPRHITLPEGLAGVSRRHCTFVHDGDSLVLLDHSTFGTFVNGERVMERVRVHAGDRIRLGEPGIELSLIAVGELPSRPPDRPDALP